MLILGITTIIFIILLIKTKDWESLWVYMPGGVIALIVAVIVGCTVPTQYKILLEQELVQLDNGSYYVDVVNVNGSAAYLFATMNNGKENLYNRGVGNEFSGVYIMETSKVTPKYVRQKKVYPNWSYLFVINTNSSEYVLYIPKDSINYEYNIKH